MSIGKIVQAGRGLGKFTFTWFGVSEWNAGKEADLERKDSEW